jgi:hypothetical protein
MGIASPISTESTASSDKEINEDPFAYDTQTTNEKTININAFILNLKIHFLIVSQGLSNTVKKSFAS